MIMPIRGVKDVESARQSKVDAGLRAEMKRRQDAAYQDYLSRIAQYQGTSFYEELLNNPYYQYQDYEPGFLETIGYSGFGISNRAQTWLNERRTSGDEYMSQILDAKRTQEYSSPASEVARRQAAGLNDDLNGGQAIGTGEASDVAPDDTPPSNSPESGSEFIDVASKVAQLGISFFEEGASLIGFLQDYAGKEIANAKLDLDLTNTGYDQAVKLLAGSSSLPGTFEEYAALSEEEKASLDTDMIGQLKYLLFPSRGKGIYSTKTANRLMKILSGIVSYDKEGKPTLAYETYRSKLLAERYGAHKQAAGVIGTPGFSEDLLDFGQHIADTFGAIDLAIKEAQKRTVEAGAESSEARASYDSSFYTSDLGASDRSARVAGNQASISQSKNIKIIEDLRKSVNEKFESLYNYAKTIGGIKGSLLQLLVPLFRAQTEQIINNGLGATFVDRSGFGTFANLLTP